MGRVKFLKKWREFLGGGNDIWVFLKKGKLPHRAEQEEQSRRKEEQAERLNK